jgi:ubiquinone/menaquinone biosynthesis C-methylase UbiE
MNNDRKAMIRQAFDTVASGYDHPSLPFFPETARHMLDTIRVNDGAHILDVCTGTGAVALRMAEKFRDCQITGIDLSSGMLQQAQRKAEQKNLANVNFIQMDLDHLSFPAAQFDVATCSFGLFFLPDMLAALNNIKQVVKPGGSIVISSFVDGAFEPFSDIFLQRYQSFGKEIPPLSWKRLCNESLIRELFAQAGIHNITFKQAPLGHAIKTAQQWWDVVWNAGYRGLLNQLTEQQRVEFESQHRQEISDYCADGKARLNTGVIIANAVL